MAIMEDLGVFTFKMRLKCGRKGCGRTMGSASVTFNRSISQPHLFRLGFVDDLEWLDVFVPEGVPYEIQKDETHNPVRYKFHCGWRPPVKLADGGLRGRDEVKVKHVGCKADHVVKRATLEKAMLKHMGLDSDEVFYNMTSATMPTLVERYRAAQQHWVYVL